MTDAQERCITYHLWKSQDQITYQDWEVARLNIDKHTASDIISAFKKGDTDVAVNQIKHLCKS